MGIASTVTSAVLLLIAIVGVVPFIRGGAVAGCAGDGPHLIFLLAWGTAAILGLASAIHLSTARGRPEEPSRRRSVAFWGAVVVVVGAAALFVVVILDGLGECGF